VSGRSQDGRVRREPLSVVIADSEARARRELRRALEADGFVVLAEARDADSAVAATVRERPQICLIELALPGQGLDAIPRIANEAPGTLVVVLTESDRSSDVITALMRGASGYLLKGLSGERLAWTLRRAHHGEPALSRALVAHLINEIRRGPARRLSLPDRQVTLTPREWDVGELLVEGRSAGEIAAQLGVSPVTVRRHIGLLVRKLGAPNREVAIDLLRTYGRR
jgi:two-component system nitrate/nitrite response regulator NarL